MVEWGSGNGRDSLFFAAQGHNTVAMDLSIEAVNVADTEAKSRGLHGAVQFLQGDLSSGTDVRNAVRIARTRDGDPSLVFYCRFVLHSLDESEEGRFLSALSNCMHPGECIFLEFRTKEDINRQKHYPMHFRRYLDSEQFQRTIESSLGFTVKYSVTGIGMAKYRDEDPVVTRIIAAKG